MFITGKSSAGQFLLYLTISSIAAGVNLGIGFCFYALAGLSAGGLFAFSVAVGYVSGMLVNWAFNRVITFPRSGRRKLAEFKTFFVVALGGLLLTVILAAVFRSTVAAPVARFVATAGEISRPSIETVAQIMAVGMVAIYSFLGHKWFTFSRGIRFRVGLTARMSRQSLSRWMQPDIRSRANLIGLHGATIDRRRGDSK